MTPATDRWRDRIGLGLLAAMVSLPFLQPRHFNPIPSFWGEWWAVALGLAAAAVLLVREGAWRPGRLPGVMLIPLIFCAAAVLQIALRRVLFAEQALLHAALLLWAALLMLLGRQVRERCGLERVVDVLAIALLAGALANAAIALLQSQHATGFAGGWIFPLVPGYRPYGNVGQSNHLNHHMWLGILSALYLHQRGRLSLAPLWAALLPLLLAATLTTSRSIFLYAALLPALAWPLARLGGDPSSARRWFGRTWPLLPAVLLLQWLTKSMPQELVTGSASERLFEEVSGTGIRLRLLAAGWREFLDAPWLGNGIGSFSWNTFLSNEQVGADWAPGVAEHAHNIVAHLLAEFGLVPSLLAAMVLARWARRFFSGHWQIGHLWIAGILGIAGIHSLLEYPLWYAFFLGLTALLLGMSVTPAFEIENGRRGAVLALAIVLGAAVPLAALRQDYATLESALNRRHAPAAMRATLDELLQLQRNSLLAPHVLAMLAVTMEPSTEHLADKIAVCERAQQFAPSNRIVFKCAVLLQLAQRDADAARQLQRALHAFPEDRAKVAKELDQLAASYPQLAPLRAMAEKPAAQSREKYSAPSTR